VKNAHIDPVTLTFDLSTPNPSHLEYIPRSFPTPSFNTLRSFVFSYATDKQTDKQTDGLENPTDADHMGVVIITVKGRSTAIVCNVYYV